MYTKRKSVRSASDTSDTVRWGWFLLCVPFRDGCRCLALRASPHRILGSYTPHRIPCNEDGPRSTSHVRRLAANCARHPTALGAARPEAGTFPALGGRAAFIAFRNKPRATPAVVNVVHSPPRVYSCTTTQRTVHHDSPRWVGPSPAPQRYGYPPRAAAAPTRDRPHALRTRDRPQATAATCP